MGRDESDDKNEGECVNKGPSRVRARRAAVTLESPFYGSLNEALRSANRTDIKDFFHWYVGPMFQSQDNSTRSPHRQKHVLILASQVILLILFDFSKDSLRPTALCLQDEARLERTVLPAPCSRHGASRRQIGPPVQIPQRQ